MALGGTVDDALVGPTQALTLDHPLVLSHWTTKLQETYLRVDVLEPKVEDWISEAGLFCRSFFLVKRVTPPSLAGCTPMACPKPVSIYPQLSPVHFMPLYVQILCGNISFVPYRQPDPHTTFSQPIVSDPPRQLHTLRLY